MELYSANLASSDAMSLAVGIFTLMLLRVIIYSFFLGGRGVGQFYIIPRIGELLSNSRPTRLSVYIETNTESSVLVLNDFLDSTRHTRLLSSEGFSDSDVHIASFR
jgi:hypothetical protein